MEYKNIEVASKQDVFNYIDSYLASFTKDEDKIMAINELKVHLHMDSPFNGEPVDCVQWILVALIEANDYNPNVMAPPEKRLLKRSLEVEGFTQPIIATVNEGKAVVIDGFHRFLIGGTEPTLVRRLKGYLPISFVNDESSGEKDRIAATIRHNRARGKHQIKEMSCIVRELYRLGWSDIQIGTELGMEPDEVLRLKQITGLSELFADSDFNHAWTVI